MDQALKPGLYIVATPIGNLGDLSTRAAAVLGAVAAVACEDTRVTGKLIDKARLRAVPHATLSMEAKMGMSKNPNMQ